MIPCGSCDGGQVGMTHDGQPIVCDVCGGFGRRDFSALYIRGACVICASTDCSEAHAVLHLSEGTAVVQMEKIGTGWKRQILPTSDVPIVDGSGDSIWEHDYDTWARNDVNAENLRAAYAKARALTKEHRRKVAAAAKGQAA